MKPERFIDILKELHDEYLDATTEDEISELCSALEALISDWDNAK